MPRPRPPHLHKEITRHGKTVWYVRRGKGLRVRLPGAFGSDEFRAAYEAAMLGSAPRASGKKPDVGSLAWAIELYRQSAVWLNLSAATRKQRENIFLKIKETAGAERLVDISRATIVSGRDRRAATPAAARHFVETLRGLFIWAVDSALVTLDPTMGVKVPRAKTDGFAVWTEEDIAAYEARWPVGTRERVAFAVLLYTGLRRGDAVRLGPPHVKADIARITTAKTGERVTIVLAEDLVRILVAGPCGDLTYIAGERGLPRVKESFGEWFRVACHAAGVKKTAHGLRKAAATRAANNGASESELEAIFGWRGGRMASHYTKSADRERLSLNAADKLHGRKR